MGKYVVFVVCLWIARKADAYTPLRTPEGGRYGLSAIALVGNSVNQSGLDAGSLAQSVLSSLARWKEASGGRIAPEYWQGTDRGQFVPATGYDGISRIYFASQTQEYVPAGVLGLAQVWYDTRTGVALEADIVLNDRGYRFTQNPLDSSQGGGNRVYVDSVLTHELGHAFGFAHSSESHATMAPYEGAGRYELGCDDRAGSLAFNGAASAGAAGVGSIRGRVRSEGGSDIFGAVVQAVSRTRGEVQAAVLSERDGTFEIGGLPPGAYAVQVTSFPYTLQSLPGFYSGIVGGLCTSQQAEANVMLGSSVDVGNLSTRTFSSGGCGSVAIAGRNRCERTAALPSIPYHGSQLPPVASDSQESDDFGFCGRPANASTRRAGVAGARSTPMRSIFGFMFGWVGPLALAIGLRRRIL